MYDGADSGIGSGIVTEPFTYIDEDSGEEMVGMKHPSDGSFCVNILAHDIPDELKIYEIFPNIETIKHSFS